MTDHRSRSAEVKMSTPVLHQFQFSHYNEKARWALDFKNVAHVRHSLLPGPHMIQTMRLSGQKSVPVLGLEGDVVAGSAQIIDALEQRFPEPPLYPATIAEQRQALELQKWFDEEVGPEIRRAFFFDVLPGSKYAAELFIIGRGDLTKAIYRTLFPGIRAVMIKDMKIDAAGAARGVERTKEALDLVAKCATGSGYLVGDRFTVADLTAAALLSPTAMPPQFSYPVPEPRSDGLRRWLSRWSDHPGTAWVSEIYRKHRGASAAVDREG
jgi:glutathione S-transferase